MENKTLGIIFTAGIAVLIGVFLISIIADSTNSVTSLSAATNETLSISGAVLNGGTINASYQMIIPHAVTTGTWKSEYSECAIPTIVFRNQTGSIMTLTTHYAYTAGTGVLTLVNTLPLNQTLGAVNTTSVSYAYCPENYVGSWGGTVTKMVVGFFAIGLLGAALYFMYSIFKSEGVALD